MKKILLVDDNPDLFMVPMISLEDRGYTVLTAEDGLAAQKILEDDREVALVITDTQMPKMDGIQLVRWIKTEAKLSMPVVISTGSVDDAVIARVTAAGADGVLRKPYALDDFLRVVQQLLSPIVA